MRMVTGTVSKSLSSAGLPLPRGAEGVFGLLVGMF